MRILLWHVHGSWTTAFVQGGHDYLLPVTPDRGPDGLGRARTWDWPANVIELPPEQLASADVDLVVLQRPHEVELCRQWLRREPGRDVAAVYVEHNTPVGNVPDVRHPMADQDRIPIIHVTGFNELMWDNGRAMSHVIDHGIPDPGYRYTGDIERAAVVVNEPVRRGRSVGTDLVQGLADTHPVDVFGMVVDPLATPDGRIRTYDDLPQGQLHEELPRRRVYLHSSRWTSLGLSLLEAMFLGMPVVALATTEAFRAVPPEAGALVTRPEQIERAVAMYLAVPEAARLAGEAAREHVRARYGLDRFLDEWDQVLAFVARASAAGRAVTA